MTGNRFSASSGGSIVTERARASDMALCAVIAITGMNVSAVLNDQFGFSVVGKASVAMAAVVLLSECLRGLRPWIAFDRLGTAVLLIYLATYGLGVFWAYDPGAAIAQLDSLYRDAIVALVTIAIISSFDALRIAVRAFYLTLAAVASLSAAQVFTGSYDATFGGLAGAAADHAADGVAIWRVTGPFGDPNSYGRVLLIGLPLAMQEVFAPSTRAWKIAAYFSLVFLLVALFGTYSRGALFGLIAISVPLALKLRRYWWVQAVAIVLVVALASQSHYGQRVGSAVAVLGSGATGTQTDLSTLGRLDEMRLAGKMFKEYPLGGLGPGGYRERFQQYSNRYHAVPRNEDREAHSLPLEIAAEGGLIMLAAFLGLCLVLANNVFHALRICRSRIPHHTELVAGLGLSMAAYLAASLVLHADFSRLFWLLCGLILALPVCVSRVLGPDAAGGKEVRIPLVRALGVS